MTSEPIVIVREPSVTVLARPQFVEPASLPMPRAGEASDAERVAEFAGRVRTMSHSNPAARETREYLATLPATSLDEVRGHVHFAVLVEGVSQSQATELTQRAPSLAITWRARQIVDASVLACVLPPAIEGDQALEETWLASMREAHARYHALVDDLMSRYGWVDDKVHRRSLARDAASAVLPGSTEARFVASGSARAWRAALPAIANAESSLELRRLGVALWQVLHREARSLFDDVVCYTAADRRDALR